MSTPKRAQLHAALQSIQMHAAGMHAAADLAMRLLADLGQRDGLVEQMRAARSAGQQHYSKEDPAAEVAELIEQARAGGRAPTPAQDGADTTPSRE